MKIRAGFFAILILAACCVAAQADRKPPAIDPIGLANAQLAARRTLDQAATVTAHPAFNIDHSAHTAQLTGTGTASLDSGAMLVKGVDGGASLTVVISNTEDPGFQPCRDALAQGGKLTGPVNVTGHGYYNLGLQNGAINQATVTLDVVTSCDPGPSQ